MCRPGFWLVQRVVREPVVAVVEQSVTASRYVDCVVPCKSVVFGRSTSSVMTICMINRGCVGLVSGSYSGSYVSQCCSGRTVRNSESLRGLRCTLQECRGRGKARALLGPLAVRTYRTGTKALPCQSRADNGYG